MSEFLSGCRGAGDALGVRLSRLEANKTSRATVAAPLEAEMEVHVPQPWNAVTGTTCRKSSMLSARRTKMRLRTRGDVQGSDARGNV